MHQYTYLRVEFSQDYMRDIYMRMKKVTEEGKSWGEKLHPTVADRHFDTRIKAKF